MTFFGAWRQTIVEKVPKTLSERWFFFLDQNTFTHYVVTAIAVKRNIGILHSLSLIAVETLSSTL